MTRLQQQADAILARAERVERMRAAHQELYDLLRAYVALCLAQGINLGGVTGEAIELIAKIDGDAK